MSRVINNINEVYLINTLRSVIKKDARFNKYTNECDEKGCKVTMLIAMSLLAFTQTWQVCMSFYIVHTSVLELSRAKCTSENVMKKQDTNRKTQNVNTN